MARVDPNDESIERWVVQRYRFDPDRNERRNVTEVAFDNAEEFDAYMHGARERLRAEQAEGSAESVEHYTGTVHEAGHQERMMRRRHGLPPR